ncbi:hypothetical protein D9613_006567 [Agrocybe pediades]|uniref:Uncharacterized protein n=1 Tax=Agrocybe pediades TaxID=84607 RepID=A0A8H4VK70_9AGAR|nr:hypothetical protein D9613_006567 [Agrocybe pediades]
MKSIIFSTILGAVLLVSQAAAAPQASTTTLHCTNPGAVLGPYEEPINFPTLPPSASNPISTCNLRPEDMQIVSISLVALVATFSSQVMATPAPQLSTPSFQCSSPQAATIGGHNKVLKYAADPSSTALDRASWEKRGFAL